MKIGNVEIEKPIALAPMEDVSDTSFRLICKRLGADILYTEFTSSEAIIRDVRTALHKIQITDEERPIAIQIFGGRETSMEYATKIVEQANPDFIDINCGCWVKNLAARGEGAGLLRDLPRFESIVTSTVKATKLPVTVKTRLGWDKNSIVILEVAKMIEQAGAKALALHCRTRDQGHNGSADWTWLEKIKRAISIPLIGNGDLNSPEDIKRMFETGCDGVMIGRGAISNPFIFKQAKYFLQHGVRLPDATLQERIELCIEHLKLSIKYKGPRDGVISFRKHYTGYLSGIPNIAKLRAELTQMLEFEKIVTRLHQFLDEDHSSLTTATAEVSQTV